MLEHNHMALLKVGTVAILLINIKCQLYSLGATMSDRFAKIVKVHLLKEISEYC